MKYERGGVYPLTNEPAFSDQILAAPLWAIMRVRSGAEAGLASLLTSSRMSAGVSEAWAPMDQIWRKGPGGRKTPQLRAKVPGYVYARLSRVPNWHIFPQRAGRDFLGFVQRGPLVVSFRDDSPALTHWAEFLARHDHRKAMEQAERAEQERLAAMVWDDLAHELSVKYPPVEGQEAEILSGPFKGQKGVAVDVGEDLVRIMMGLVEVTAKRRAVRSAG